MFVSRGTDLRKADGSTGQDISNSPKSSATIVIRAKNLALRYLRDRAPLIMNDT